MNIEPLNIPPIPQSILGRLRKDGKRDRRFKYGYYYSQELLEEVSGNYDRTNSQKQK